MLFSSNPEIIMHSMGNPVDESLLINASGSNWNVLLKFMNLAIFTTTRPWFN